VGDLMICFRDRTFCGADNCKKFFQCPSALTLEVKEAAVKWWGNEEAPIAMYLDTPSCYEEDEVIEWAEH